jgi:hypothetical protein
MPTVIVSLKSLHLQTPCARLGWQTLDFPRSEDYVTRLFSLSMHPCLPRMGQERIVRLLCQAWKAISERNLNMTVCYRYLPRQVNMDDQNINLSKVSR